MKTRSDAELAEILQQTKNFVQTQCRTKAWPHLRVGQSIRFTDDHIAQILRLLEVAPSAKAQAADTWGRPN